jgi:hypothetical protein
MTAGQITKLAFLEELHNIYRARGWDTSELSKMASVEELHKHPSELSVPSGASKAE